MAKKKKLTAKEILDSIPYADMGKHGVRLELDLSKRAPEKPRLEPNTMYR